MLLTRETALSAAVAVLRRHGHTDAADELERTGDPVPALRAMPLDALRSEDVLPVLALARLVCVVMGDHVEPRVDVPRNEDPTPRDAEAPAA